MHNAWVTTAGEKMSKSLGNSLLVDQVVSRFRPIELRYYLIGAHYRSMLEYSDAAVREAGAGFQRIEGFLRRALPGAATRQVDPTARPEAFTRAMDDDLSVPAALAVVHDTVRSGNTALSRGAPAEDEASAVLSMLDVLGVNPYAPHWATASDDRGTLVIDALVRSLLEQRAAARRRQDFAAADAIRSELEAMGISVEDTVDGARWTMG